MKKINGNIWIDSGEKGKIKIGFTKDYLETKLQECFHVLPADNFQVKDRGPLMVLETNDGLETIYSPANGRIIFFADKAKNFPDRLVEEDVVVEIEVPKPVEKVKKTTAKPPEKLGRYNITNWHNMPPEDDFGVY
jgi:hypothetical protein